MPYITRSAKNKANGNPATAYYGADNSYVVVDDITHEVIQISDLTREWFPDSTIVDPPGMYQP